jgi:hypothetical protein
MVRLLSGLNPASTKQKNNNKILMSAVSQLGPVNRKIDAANWWRGEQGGSAALPRRCEI